MDDKKTSAIPFAVTLRPNRSLSREGLVGIIALVAALNLVAGLFFWVAGAWPVLGFMGLDVALIWWAMRRNWLDGDRYERIAIDGDVVTLQRKPHRSERSQQDFNRRWLRVHLEMDEARELIGRLYLAYRGERHEIGSFLGAEDRLSLSKALRAALAGQR
jgi:uncharacterized membrane protein